MALTKQKQYYNYCLVTTAYCLLLTAYCLLPAFSGYAYSQDVVPKNMLLIPSGEFTMGSGDDSGQMGIDYGIDEVPKREIFVEKFAIDKYEVSNAEYRKYLEYLYENRVRLPYYDDFGVPVPEEWRYRRGGKFPLYGEGADNNPVNDVDWYMANGYCRWTGKRLPTEEEWEKAAGGVDGRRYPWGDEENDGHANTREQNKIQNSKFKIQKVKVEGWKTEDGRQKAEEGSNSQFSILNSQSTMPRGSFPKDQSPYGVYDMGGNVAEWTASLYRPYPGSPVPDREVFKREFYVVKGGSYLIHARESARVSSRYHMKPTRMPRAADAWHGDGMVGFRCAKSVGGRRQAVKELKAP